MSDCGYLLVCLNLASKQITMRSILSFIICLFIVQSSVGQTRVNITSGGVSIFQTGFYLHSNSNVSFVTDISDRFSVSFGVGLMAPKKLHGRQDFTYCDSFEQFGWQRSCVDGYDSIVHSGYYYQYKKTEVGIHALWRNGKDNRHLTGFGFNAIVFSRQRFIDDALFPVGRLETGKALTVTAKHLYEIPLFKQESGVKMLLYLEGGFLYTHQNDCTDVNCNNFFEGESLIHLTSSVQLGLSFDLN